MTDERPAVGPELDAAIDLVLSTGDPVGTIPPYSTDWGAAGLVVERMRELEFDVALVLSRGMWHCVFDDNISGCSGGQSSDAETAPEVICRAALRALEARDAG